MIDNIHVVPVTMSPYPEESIGRPETGESIVYRELTDIKYTSGLVVQGLISKAYTDGEDIAVEALVDQTIDEKTHNLMRRQFLLVHGTSSTDDSTLFEATSHQTWFHKAADGISDEFASNHLLQERLCVSMYGVSGRRTSRDRCVYHGRLWNANQNFAIHRGSGNMKMDALYGPNGSILGIDVNDFRGFSFNFTTLSLPDDPVPTDLTLTYRETRDHGNMPTIIAAVNGVIFQAHGAIISHSNSPKTSKLVVYASITQGMDVTAVKSYAACVLGGTIPLYTDMERTFEWMKNQDESSVDKAFNDWKRAFIGQPEFLQTSQVRI